MVLCDTFCTFLENVSCQWANRPRDVLNTLQQKANNIALSVLDRQVQSYLLVTERPRCRISLISLRVTYSVFLIHILHGHLFSVVTRLLAGIQRNLSSILGRAHSVQTGALGCTKFLYPVVSELFKVCGISGCRVFLCETIWKTDFRRSLLRNNALRGDHTQWTVSTTVNFGG
jgi:hypothetical protein